MQLLLVFIPLLTSLIFMLFGNLLTVRYLAGSAVLLLAVLPIVLFFSLPYYAAGQSDLINLGEWVNSGLFVVNWNFNFDPLTYTMLIVVLTVSLLVHFYSTDYMTEDPHLGRFISYLSLFTFFMLLLITADNFVSLFLGWEGVGLCSYLLISFWQTRIQANKAAIKAMVVNRITDLTFTLGIVAAFYTFQTVEFGPIFGLAPYVSSSSLLFGNVNVSSITLITVLLFFGATGKSAQLGFHTWLPDAMEGWLLGLFNKLTLQYAGTVESYSVDNSVVPSRIENKPTGVLDPQGGSAATADEPSETYNEREVKRELVALKEGLEPVNSEAFRILKRLEAEFSE